MNLFLDSSVVLAACGRPAGASRAIFDMAARNVWTLMTSAYVLNEVTRNLPRLPAQAFPGLGATSATARSCSGRVDA